MTPLFLAFLQLAQPSPAAQDQPLKNWKVQRREPNPKTGKMEIVADMEGDSAVRRTVAKGKELVDVTGLRLVYFTDPKKPDQKSEEIKLSSDTARWDEERDRVDLAGHVHAEKQDPDRVDADKRPVTTVIEAPEATLLFKKKFVCPEHAGKETAPGKCSLCGADLKPRTFTTILAPKAFEMTKTDPRTRLLGEGLTASDDLRQARVERDGDLYTTGVSAAELTAASTAPPPKKVETEMRSKGPMTYVEGEDGTIVATGEKDVHVSRTEYGADGPETTTVQSDAAELVARRSMGPKKELEPERLSVQGHARMAGRGTTALADSLIWKRSEDYDVADLEGSVEVQSDKNIIRSKSARIERLLGVSTFRDDVSGSLVAGKKDDPPIGLKCRTLVTHALPGSRDLEELEALDQVILEGLNPGGAEKPGQAEADRFVWYQGANHGFLEKRPFVKVIQEDRTIFAPRIILEGRSMIVLKGPKRMVLSQNDSDGRPVHYHVSAEGDIVFNSSGQKKIIRLQDHCAVRTKDFQLFSDFMIVTATDENAIEALHAWGRVRAHQSKDKEKEPGKEMEKGKEKEEATLFGEWLLYEPATKTRLMRMTIAGSPQSVVEAGRKVSIQEQVLFYEKVDPSTGQKVQYQELVAGRRGVRITGDDRPR